MAEHSARRTPGSMWHLDEMVVTLSGEPYLTVTAGQPTD
jgi:hypothetical protein